MACKNKVVAAQETTERVPGVRCLPARATSGVGGLINVVADMTSQRDRNALEMTVVDVLAQLLGARLLELWRVIEHRGGPRLRLLAGHAEGDEVAMSDPTLDPSECPRINQLPGALACYQTRRAVAMPVDEAAGVYAYFFPLLGPREATAVLAVETRRPLGVYEEQLIEGLLRIYRNHLELLDYGEHDTLTGLLNRKPFEARFAQFTSSPASFHELHPKVRLIGDARRARPGEGQWLAVVDIDHFKRINDGFGHVFGDEVLLLLARLMKASFRSTDTLFRFGGEEFVILLSGTDEAGARVALEHFRQRVEDHVFPQVGQITVSIGYARASRREGAMAAYEQADAALYYGKEHGRNCVFGYEVLVREGALARKQAAGNMELF